MKKTAIFYNSITGGAREIAAALASALKGETDALDINDVDNVDLSKYGLVVLGASTWNVGESDEWDDFLAKLDPGAIGEVTFALYGLGDQREFPDHFLDTMGMLYDRLMDLGATLIGQTETAGYAFRGSAAVVDGHFVGLAIDQENQPEMTPVRLKSWVERLRAA